MNLFVRLCVIARLLSLKIGNNKQKFKWFSVINVGMIMIVHNVWFELRYEFQMCIYSSRNVLDSNRFLCMVASYALVVGRSSYA